MKLYILRWNPNFSMPYEAHLEGLKMLRKNHISSNWSIHDHEALEEGDIFLFNQVGTGANDGIAGFGTFVSEPYTAPNWKTKDGTNRFYADMLMQCLLDRRGENIFSAQEMEKHFPEIDWHRGHAGVLVPAATTESLLTYMMIKLLPLETPTEKISFFPECGTCDLAIIFAKYINGCCPNLKAQIIAQNELEYENYKEGEDIDESLIEISDDIFQDMSVPENCTIDDIIHFFQPVI